MNKIENFEDIQLNLNYQDLLMTLHVHKENLKRKTLYLIVNVIVISILFIFLMNTEAFVIVAYLLTCGFFVIYQIYTVLRLRFKIIVGLEMLEKLKEE